MWNEFAELVDSGIRLFIPEIKPFIHEKFARPLSTTIRELIKLKHNLWNKYLKTKNKSDFTKYKEIRNKVNSEIRKRDRDEQLQIASMCKSNPKKFWNFVNHKTKCLNGIPDIKYVDQNGLDILADNDEDKAEVFNDYFKTVFNDRLDEDDPNKVELQFDNVPEMPSVDIQEFDVLKQINKLNVNKSPGVDGIHPRVLKEIGSVISVPLTLIFRCSLKTGVLPVDWRSANIAAIYKKGKKNIVNNYRPVSLTSITCKMLESILRDHIMKFLTNNGLLSERQYGFVKGRSVVTQLLRVMDDWTRLLENGGQVDVVYTDLEKAFDKVPHKMLVAKLKQLNLNESITRWIESFLVNRRQRVKINDCLSKWTPVVSGIPQGTVLGPLLFIIYINDIVNFCQSGSHIFLYADDAKIFRYIKDEKDFFLLQADIHDMVRWLNDALLRLNVSKCKNVSFGRNICVYNYEIDNTKIERQEFIRDLGIIFDKKLKFDLHVKEKVAKANNILGIIKRNFKNLSQSAGILLYKSLARSHLEYAVQVWSPYRKGDIDALEKVQMRATKMLCKNKNLTYKERLRLLNIPTLKFRRHRGDMIEVFKIVHDIYDKGTTVKLSFHNSSRTRGHGYKLYQQHVKYDLRKYFFNNRIIALWNGLPDCVVSAPSVNSFKNRLDKFWENQEARFDVHVEIAPAGSASL